MSTLVEERARTVKSFLPAARLPERSAPEITSPQISEEPYRVLDREGYQLSMGAVPEHEDERPPEDIVRGRCPECGKEIVANLYWHTQQGYLLRYECWEGIMPNGQCRFYAVP